MIVLRKDIKNTGDSHSPLWRLKIEATGQEKNQFIKTNSKLIKTLVLKKLITWENGHNKENISIKHIREDTHIDGVGDDYHKIAHILTGFFSRQFCFPLYAFLYFTPFFFADKMRDCIGKECLGREQEGGGTQYILQLLQ